ncbi:MAG: cysteine desulfurase family protein [Aquificaceae bacterium]
MIYEPYSSFPFPEVFREVYNSLPYFFINPSGINALSTKSKEMLVRSRAVMAEFLKCANSEIIFTSSSTESNNLAIKGAVWNKKGSIITTDFEHPSILHPLKTVSEKQGLRIVYLETDKTGYVDPKCVKDAVLEDTLLLTMGAVCRETATLRDVNGIVRAVKETNPNTLCHFDLWGLYYPTSQIDLRELDMASLDGPFLLGPQGIGILYIRKNVRIRPLIEGGVQEKGLRAGEENLFGIFSLSKSVTLLMEREEAVKKSLSFCDKYIMDNLHLPPIFKENWRAPGLFSYGLRDTEAEMLISFMGKEGFFLSYPSPCVVNRVKSRTKQKYGFGDLLFIRIPPLTSIGNIRTFLNTLKDVLEKIGSTV